MPTLGYLAAYAMQAVRDKLIEHKEYIHGLSYEYIVASLGTAVRGRLIIAHLGNGASLAAVYNGQPLDTSMGFTPTGGIMMGTRSGDLDPGVIIHFMHDKGYDASQLDALVNQQAGLLGVSGLSPAMKTLLEQRRREPHAAQAVELFCYQLRKYIGALTAVLGGLDTLVFTGGIGERRPSTLGSLPGTGVSGHRPRPPAECGAC